MKADLEDLGNLKYRMSVEVDLDQLREMRRRLARAYSSRVNLRGFRPGHAPLEMVMRQLGPALEVEAREAVVGETLGKALEEKKLKPSTEPKVEIGEDGPGGEVRYTAEFEAFPIMEPKDYLGVEVEEPTLPPITEETVDEVVGRMQQRASTFEPKAEDGVGHERDLAVCSFVLKSEDGGEVLKELPESRVMVGTDDEPVMDVGRELLGMKAGEEKSVIGEVGRITARALESAGKAAERVMAVFTVKQVLGRVVPVVDDEFAAKHSGAATVAEMRDRIRAGMEKARADQAKELMREAVIAAVLKANPIEVGAATIDRMISLSEEELKGRLLPAMSPEERAKLDLGIPREKSEADARAGIARTIVLQAIAEKEGVSVTAEEFDAKLAELAAERNLPLPKLRARTGGEDGDALRRHLRIEKTIDLLARYAVARPAGEAPAGPSPQVVLTDAPAAAQADGPRVELTDAPAEPAGGEEAK